MFLLGCVESSNGDIVYFKDINQTGVDSNQVKVSANDTTPGYLNGKLVAGANITLTENNNGGNETLTISSTASGGGTDTNCSTSPDCNNLYIRKNPIGSETIFHENGEQFIISQDGNVGNSTSVGGAFLLDNTDNNGAAMIIYSNAGSEANGRLLNIRADNTGFDQAVVHIDNDGTANTLEIVNNSTDSSSQSLNVVSNNPNDTTLGINGVETSKGTLKIVHNVAGGGDSSASGISIDLQGEGTQSQGIYVDSTSASGTRGDLLRLRNRSIDQFTIDANGNTTSISDINGFRLCIQDDCRTSWPTSGSGKTYTSGTPSTIQVDNDNNTISQNFDGNFWRMFALGEPYIDGNALAVVNALDLNNSLSYAKTDTNCSFNLNCTITGTIDTNNNADFNGSIIRFRKNVLAPDINIATTVNRVDVINVKQVNCANNTRSCLEANVNQKIFSVASGTAFLVFVNPQRYVGLGTVSGGIDLYPHRFYTSGGGDGSWISMARTTDPAGQEQFAGRLYLKQLTTSEGQDVNAWQQQQTNGGSFLQLGAIQYGDFRVVGDTNLSNLTINRIGKDVNITNQVADGNISLNVRNVNGDLNNGLTIFKGGRLSAPNLKTMNAGGKLPLSWDSNHEIVVDVSSASQKINIRDLNVVVDTSRLSFLKPRVYEDAVWGGQGSGYLAEEVEPFYPELVVRDNTGKIMGVDYQTLSIYFSAELLVQKQRADKLQTKLDLFVNTYCLTHIQEPACLAVNQTGLP